MATAAAKAQRRETLLKQKQQREKEVAEKRQKLEVLRARKGVYDFDDMLHDVLETAPPNVGSMGELSLAELFMEPGTYTHCTGIVDVTVHPKESDTYTKSVQCEIEEYEDDMTNRLSLTSSNQRVTTRTIGKRSTIAATDLLSHISRLSQMGFIEGDEEEEAEKEAERERKEEAHKKRLLASPEFATFLARSSRIVERTLAEQVAEERAKQKAAEKTEQSAKARFQIGGAKKNAQAPALELVDELVDPRALYRPCMNVSFSPKFPELFLAAYGQATSGSIHDPEGVVIAWSAHLPKRPEFYFTAPSPVLCAQFNKYAPHQVVGCTYSGSIVVWDARLPKPGPVQRSHPHNGHALPVYNAVLSGTTNAHSLTSVSTDGRLCVWSLANLKEPTEVLELSFPKTSRTSADAPYAVTAMDMPANDTNTLYVGGEDGSLGRVYLHGSADKVGITDTYASHEGLVTGLSCHPAAKAAAVSTSSDAANPANLLLTTSVDWTVKLWAPKLHSQPLFSFDGHYDEFVWDCQWHPNHPAVFAACDGEGHLDVWNINHSIETPIHRAKNPGGNAINHIAWAPDGKRLLSGDATGKVLLYSLEKDLADGGGFDELPKLTERVQQWLPHEDGAQFLKDFA